FAPAGVAALHLDRRAVGADVAEGTGVQAGFARRRHHRRVAAETAAVDADAAGRGDTLVDRPVGGVEHVVHDPGGPVAVGHVHEGLAEAAGTAEVHLQHRVAAAGEQLGFPVVLPVVAYAHRAAVRVDDQ